MRDLNRRRVFRQSQTSPSQLERGQLLDELKFILEPLDSESLQAQLAKKGGKDCRRASRCNSDILPPWQGKSSVTNTTVSRGQLTFEPYKTFWSSTLQWTSTARSEKWSCRHSCDGEFLAGCAKSGRQAQEQAKKCQETHDEANFLPEPFRSSFHPLTSPTGQRFSYFATSASRLSVKFLSAAPRILAPPLPSAD